MMRSCKVSQSLHFARPGRGESSSRDGALSPASVRSEPAWSTEANNKDDTVGKEEGNRHNIRKQKLSFKTDWLQKYAKHIFDNNPKSEKDKVEYLECFGTEW